MSIRKLVLTMGAVGAVAVAMAGCSSGSGTPSGNPSNFGGQTVQVWSSVDQPVQDGLAAKLIPAAKALGINVKWSRITNINQLLVSKVQANDPPDIALLPQPGIIKDLASKHKVTALDNILDMNALKQSMAAGTLDVAKVNGKTYGLLISINVKGLVFYPKKAWDAAGYQAPTTIDELNALTDKIRSDGNTPWCLGIESSTATGWPATDWLENFVLKYGGVDQYNKWIDHSLKFNSPLIQQAANEFAKIAFTNGNVLGGRSSIASNNFGTAGNAMFNSPKPGCFMYMQGSFITGFFPKSVQADLDGQVGVFGLPPASAGGDNPVEGGGDTASIYKDSKAAEKVMQLLSQTDVGTQAASNGSSFLSPHKDFPLSNYPLKLTQAIAQVAYGATGFAFDASDSMPGAVGSGSEWKELTNWVTGAESLDAALTKIDQSWPT
jgi:alpha-glucoside transport system substrate-binding protein